MDALRDCDPAGKVMSWSEATAWRSRTHGSVVFTNGVFDLVHRGHIDLLVTARAHGEALVVGVNSDASVRRLKGAGRPIRPAADRAYLLAALCAVDAVVIFEEDTPLELLLALRPDVLVKGGDYTPETVVGRQQVEGWGGRVVIVPLTLGHSTSQLIEQLRAR